MKFADYISEADDKKSKADEYSKTLYNIYNKMKKDPDFKDAADSLKDAIDDFWDSMKETKESVSASDAVERINATTDYSAVAKDDKILIKMYRKDIGYITQDDLDSLDSDGWGKTLDKGVDGVRKAIRGK